MGKLDLSCCLNWKVIAGLAVVGLGVLVVAPSLVAGVVPLLLVAICPLSMLAMAGGMMRGTGQSQEGATCGSIVGGQCASPPAQVSQPSSVLLTREEQLAELRAQLTSTQAQQEAIAHELARLES